MSLYQLEQVKKTFGTRTVLSIDSLEIREGLIYALLGPNGAGKTTLIDILGFLDSPTSGHVRFEGTLVNYSKKHLKQFRRNVVVVSQRPVLFTTSVYKNMEFGLKIRGFPSKMRRSIIEKSLEMVGMKHLINAPAVKLSGGETQRVVLARALALSPRIIICDEPTASVDMESQIVLMNLLRKISQEKGITIILSSHDRLQTSLLAHHTLFLDHGRLFDGAYENMFDLHFLKQDQDRYIYSLNDSALISLDSDIGQHKRVLLDPRKIELLADNEHPAGDNTFKGNLTQIVREKDTVRLVLDSQIQLVLMLTLEDYQARKPMIGDVLSAHISSEAIRIIQANL